MGIAIYVQGYHKEPSCISGEIKTIGWYEVSGKIYKYRIPDSDRVLHRSHFDVVTLVKNAWWDYTAVPQFVDKRKACFQADTM